MSPARRTSWLRMVAWTIAVCSLFLNGCGRSNRETAVHAVEHLERLDGAARADRIEEAIAFPESAWHEATKTSLGYLSDPAWFRIRRASKHGDDVIAVLGPANDLVEVFDVMGGEVVGRCATGDNVPPALRFPLPVPNRFPTCPLAPHAESDTYVRLGGDSPVQAAMLTAKRDAFIEYVVVDLVAQSAYFAILGALFLYNLFVYVGTLKREYLAYCAFVAAFGLLQACLTGLLPLWWPGLGGHAVNLAAGVGVVLSIAAGMTFAFVFLDGGFLGDSRSERVGRVLLACVGALTLALISVGYHLVRKVMPPFIVLGAGWTIVEGVRVAWRGERNAKFFLFAWSWAMAGTILNALRIAGHVPTNAFTSYAIQIGSVIEMLLLSFALADRMKQLQGEATRNAEVAAANAELARAATARVLDEQERANAELKRLDKLKDEFLANTSHELRTPLNGVIGLTEAVLQAEATLADASKQRLDLVLKSGRRLSSLVNDLLDFSRLQRGEFEVQAARIALAPLVREVLDTLSPSAEQKGLRLRSQVPEGLEVVADPGRVKQILTNLVGNGLKFTERGGVRVEAAQLGERVLVRVADTGIGIPKEAHERIFAAFEQADGGTARKHGGTGLGLTVTRQLVELHGGQVRVESVEGKGAAFTFDLQAAAAASLDSALDLRAWEPEPELPPRPLSDAPRFEAAHAGMRPSVRLVTRDSSGARLLVADDDPINLEVLRAVLEPAGYTLVTANDGKEAVARAYDAGPFEAVLLDVMMPKMTGLEAARAIRNDFPHGTLPVLMLTAKNRSEDVVAGLAAGADDYLAKPVNSAELLARLGAHIEGLRALKAVERLVSPGMVELADASHASTLARGHGATRGIGVLRLAFHGLELLSSRVDEHTLFVRYQEVIGTVVAGLRDHGAVIESAGDAQLSFLIPAMDDGFVPAVQRVLADLELRLGTALRLGASFHHGHLKVGVLGDQEWVTIRALGEAVYLTGAVAAWAARRGFRAVMTDACLVKFDERPRVRRLGTARLGRGGHPVTLFEALDRSSSAPDWSEAIDLLEKGRFQEVLATLARASDEDALVRYLRAAAADEMREVVLGGGE
jgi:signal transduction histidine kinase/DNA-binding response OmpR family regulator